MTAKELREKIEAVFDDIDFYYKGKQGSVCPFSHTDFSLAYDGKVKDFQEVDTLMHDKFLDGKSLYQVAEELDLW